MKYIQLTKGKQAIVDDEDFGYLNEHKWHINCKYASRIKDKKVLWMHKIIMKCPKGMQIDHINFDTLDNRKSNLRVCTVAQNNIHHRKSKNNTSGLKGVYLTLSTGKWRAMIGVNKKLLHLGYFETREKASMAYNKKAKELFGEFRVIE